MQLKGLEKKLEIHQAPKREYHKRSNYNDDKEFVPRRSSRGRTRAEDLVPLDDVAAGPEMAGYDSNQFIVEEKKVYIRRSMDNDGLQI